MCDVFPVPLSEEDAKRVREAPDGQLIPPGLEPTLEKWSLETFRRRRAAVMAEYQRWLEMKFWGEASWMECPEPIEVDASC